jgi:hypothetical protein
VRVCVGGGEAVREAASKAMRDSLVCCLFPQTTPQFVGTQQHRNEAACVHFVVNTHPNIREIPSPVCRQTITHMHTLTRIHTTRQGMQTHTTSQHTHTFTAAAAAAAARS